MDISSIVTVVGSVGFPIVACCGMAEVSVRRRCGCGVSCYEV